MFDYLYRTEDMRPEEIRKYYVERPGDRDIIAQLQNRSPIILRGSRGIGKSMLLRIAEAEMKSKFAEERILPVYVTFATASLVEQVEKHFISWMLSRLSVGIERTLTTMGLILPESSALSRLARGRYSVEGDPDVSEMVNAVKAICAPNGAVRQEMLASDLDEYRNAVQDLCEFLSIHRIVFLIDEATHVFMPNQQREFFTLMRAIRSPYLAVKAAVYPGVTSYGDAFQPRHDATLIDMDGSLSSADYSILMRKIVIAQSADSEGEIVRNGELFDLLAFACMGNPRVLLKTYSALKGRINKNSVKDVIRTFFGQDIWAEHSDLAVRYPGYAELIDWGRDFMERDVLPKIVKRNEGATEASSAIWIHRYAPESVQRALDFLCYTGVLAEDASGVRATRSEIGVRYLVNPGCNFAAASDPVNYGAEVRRNFSPKRMTEYGAQNPAFDGIHDFDLSSIDLSENSVLADRLAMAYEKLDLSDFLKSALRKLGVETVKDVILLPEETLKTIPYVGEVRSRNIRNAALAAVMEYLAG